MCGEAKMPHIGTKRKATTRQNTTVSYDAAFLLPEKHVARIVRSPRKRAQKEEAPVQ